MYPRPARPPALQMLSPGIIAACLPSGESLEGRRPRRPQVPLHRGIRAPKLSFLSSICDVRVPPRSFVHVQIRQCYRFREARMLKIRGSFTLCPSDEMVDIRDLKSRGRNPVSVRVRPWAPNNHHPSLRRVPYGTSIIPWGEKSRVGSSPTLGTKEQDKSNIASM